MKVSAEICTLLTTDKLRLIPINLRHPHQYVEFKRQRKICGWDFSDEALQAFIEKQDKKLKSLFWIMIQSKAQADGEQANDNFISDSNAVSPPSPALVAIPAGHISLDSYAEPSDPELAVEDRSIMTVQTFFILPEYQARGIGRAAMNLIEALATKEPYGSSRCHTLTLTMVNSKYVEVDDPEWNGIWKKFGLDIPKFSYESWYEKLGYVYWKEEPRFSPPTLDGSIVLVIASFMRKRLQ
ncbi:hypothetical protein ZTR_11082 [Talaromyces verruculosus]|nr:hypothetical protein ZTR_11082 [Talaromyces verruculosus]